jgi:hypothetical protein
MPEILDHYNDNHIDTHVNWNLSFYMCFGTLYINVPVLKSIQKTLIEEYQHSVV